MADQEKEANRFALQFSIHYPRLLKLASGSVKQKLMSAESRDRAKEFFLDNPRWSDADAIYVGIRAFTLSESVQVPEGVDPYWNCRRFFSPNYMFTENSEIESRLILMANEIGFRPDDMNAEQITAEVSKLIQAKARS